MGRTAFLKNGSDPCHDTCSPTSKMEQGVLRIRLSVPFPVKEALEAAFLAGQDERVDIPVPEGLLDLLFERTLRPEFPDRHALYSFRGDNVIELRL
jgi:hypothetical protein